MRISSYFTLVQYILGMNIFCIIVISEETNKNIDTLDDFIKHLKPFVCQAGCCSDNALEFSLQ